MPAFLIMDSDLQNLLFQTLPCITCISFENCAVVLSTEKQNQPPHNLFVNEYFSLHIFCSKCHNTDTSISSEIFLKNIEDTMMTLQFKCTSAYNINTLAAQRNLFSKFLKPKSYHNMDDFLNLIKCFSNHSMFTSISAKEIFSFGCSDKLLQVIRPFLENIQVHYYIHFNCIMIICTVFYNYSLYF